MKQPPKRKTLQEIDEEIRVPPPFSTDPERDEADQAAHKQRVLTSPRTEQERRLQEDYLEMVEEADTAGEVNDYWKRLSFARKQERESRATIEALGKLRGKKRTDAVKLAVTQAKFVVANALFTQGKVAEAIKALPRDKEGASYRAYYKEHLRALERDDAEECPCPAPPQTKETDAEGRTILRTWSKWEVIGRMPGDRLRKTLLLVMCRVCGTWNWRPDRPEEPQRGAGTL
jgi:hypothetical protein